MSKFIHILLLFFLIYKVQAQEELIKGIDLSSLPIVESNKGVFFDQGQETDVVKLFKENGANYVRLRLWHSPSDSNYNLEYNLELAQRIKDAGLNLLLDIFYSDTWADPSNQSKPAAWEELSFLELRDSVYQYTANVVSAFKVRGLLPEMIQVGNEINCGMLWPDGNICEDDSKWNNFVQILQSAVGGIRSSFVSSDSIKILLHSASGGNAEQTRWFFDNLLDHQVDFDIIGLSYYPWWHGSLTDLQTNLNATALRYSKEILIVETAYPWTLEWNDNVHNSVGSEDQLLIGYPATPEGQKRFLLTEIEIIKNVPNNLGLGWLYWEPAYISSSIGSSWENLAMFDFNGNSLPVIKVFNNNTTDIREEVTADFELLQNYPNPFNPTTTIEFTIPPEPKYEIKNIKLIIYNLVGQQVATLIDGTKLPGTYKVNFNGSNLSSGIYFCKLSSGKFSVITKLLLLK